MSRAESLSSFRVLSVGWATRARSEEEFVAQERDLLGGFPGAGECKWPEDKSVDRSVAIKPLDAFYAPRGSARRTL